MQGIGFELADVFKVDGEWLSWMTWSTCNVSCGGGQRQRWRTCDGPRHGGQNCSGNMSELQMCNDNLCPGKNIESTVIKT